MASSEFSDEGDVRATGTRGATAEEEEAVAPPPTATAEADGSVRRRVAVLEKKLIKMEERIKEKKAAEIEFVDPKQMRPEVLKDGTTFKIWREEFERWAGLKVKGMQEIMRWLGGRKEWSDEVEKHIELKLKESSHDKVKNEIDAQMRIALEAYTTPASQERKIVLAQRGGLRAYLQLCKHHDGC